MESVPLIPKARALPNLDTAPLLRELFQDEFEAVVPSQKCSQNVLKSLQYRIEKDEEPQTCRSKGSTENYTYRTEDIIKFRENVLKAYSEHAKKLQDIRDVEKHLFETHAHFLKREKLILENPTIRDLICLKRQPLLKALDVNYVKKYKLLQGDAGFPVEYEAKSDFRVQKFKEWRRKLESEGPGELCVSCSEKTPLKALENGPCPKPLKPKKRKKVEKSSRKQINIKEKQNDIFTTDPKLLFFTNYKLGYAYIGDIKVKNTSPKPIQFQLRPMSGESPFKVTLMEKLASALSPGLVFQLIVEFTPKSLDNAAEDIILVTEDGNRFLIPLIAYLEPPALKTHKELNEFTKNTSEKIASSYIECGSCFTGDSKVIKLNFRCYRGSGEFFIMSSENWNSGYINTVTLDNLLEIPPFRVYPVFFNIEKDQVIDLFVEFTPKHSGVQVENIVIACDNGQIRCLDLIGDAVGWHGYYFSFQESLLKELSVEEDDDVKVKYYLDFGDTAANGKIEKVFCVSNNSDMAFEFQWKIREANITSSQNRYLKLSKYQVKIDPESGTFEPKSVWEFQVTLTFNNAEIGNYRMVLSLYVLNLPYQCIEEDNTIIQPTGLVRNLYSQSLYGEEEGSALSPELTSLQGTYESLQESIKSYMEFQHRAQAAPKQDFCRTVCALNPGLCAKPLKKSKTLFNIGETLEEGDGGGCGSRPMESNSESCTSNRDEKMTEMSPQRNEIVWDFVDILVDEVELWAEVVPTRVTLQPSIIEVITPICASSYPISREVRIINHNRSPVTCSWLKAPKIKQAEQNFPENIKNGSNMFSLLFDKNSVCKGQLVSNEASGYLKHSREGWEEKEFKAPEPKEEIKTSNMCEITIKPCTEFTVAGFSELTCRIEIVACQPGKIKETFWLSVNDGDLQLKMIIMGLVVITSIDTSPDILDFGALKQGIRYTKTFTITNQCSASAFWKMNHYKFDFKENKFVSFDAKDLSSVKKTVGVLIEKRNSTTETYSLNARVPGLVFSLLEIEERNPKFGTLAKHYIPVLAEIRQPKLRLSTPRFENAILSPPELYVGQKQSTKVTVINEGVVDTFLIWGHPFGCHCRKMKVEISPRSCTVEKKQKVIVGIDLTALEEGIVSHCYIPCFFSRSEEPLILSITGVARNVNVTFEIIDYPMQNHADATSFKKSPFYHTVLRIPWPVKMYNPTLGLKYLTETEIINMKCHCQEVDEEAARAFHEPKPYSVFDVSEKSTRSLKSLEVSDSVSLRSKTSFGRSIKIMAEEYPSTSETAVCGLSALESKKSEENSLSTSSFFENTQEGIQISKSHLEFLNVPFRTPALRQFIIRNESPIETDFQISALNYGVPKKLPDRRLEIIKERVFGHCNDEFQIKLLNDQPLVFEVKPSIGKLKAFDTACIDVYCYGNTWGEYRDHLTCHIKGIEPFHLKMFVQIVGHPLYFPMFKTHTTQKATLRFQPLSPAEKAATKEIKVVNRSAIPLTVSWMVFLTKPLAKVDEIEDFDMSTESNPGFESSHSEEESTQSSKNYIPKNTSDITAKELKNLSQTSKNDSKLESLTSSTKQEKRESGIQEKTNSMAFSKEEGKSDTPFQYPGVFDVHTFQVNPREMSFEPFEEKKISITFNPEQYRSNPQEVTGMLAGCVKLQSEHENYPGLYYRPCGMNFVSELLDFTAAVELPLVSFEITKGELTFIVDSNSVIQSESKSVTMSRKFFIKNLNQKPLSLKIRVAPGRSFQVKRVSTTDKYYPEYNPNSQTLHVESGHILEMQLDCIVSYKTVMQSFEQLKINRMRDTCSHKLPETKRSSKSSTEPDNENEAKREPWKHYNETNKSSCKKRAVVDYYKLGHNDSFHINVNRMSSKSDNSTCYDFHEGKNFSPEFEGEFLELPCFVESPCKPEGPKHVVVSKEEVTFVHSGSITQTLMAELHISFPIIKISPKSLDFGNVYLGETATRYCSLINKTGFPINFRVLAKFNGGEFVASPVTGSLPSANYNTDIGKTVTIEFTPRQPGYCKEIFYAYCNLDLEFDFFEFFVSGLGTWNEKYKAPKYETRTKVESFYSKKSK